MQTPEHRINAVNAKKLPENRPQKRRRYRRPKLTPNVSLQAGQETPKFSPIFLRTETLTPIFHPYFFSPVLFFTHTFYKAFTHTFSPILFLTHTFYKVFTHTFFSPMLFTKFHPYFFSPILFFTQSYHPYFFHPFLFSPILFRKFSPILYFTHTFFHPWFLRSFQTYFCFTHAFFTHL